MKKILLIIILSISLNTYGQFEINTINVTTNDLVYDTNTDRIYVSIPSANGTNGNSIGIINSNNYTLENTIFIGSEPTILAISDDGQYIYSGFEGSSTVRRFNVITQSADIQFPLGTDDSTGSFYADDIEVMPGQPTTIAVSRMNIGFSPRHEGVAIFDNEVMRSTTTQDHTGSNKIEFADASNLFGFNNETTEFGLRRLSVNSGGITETNVVSNILSGFDVDFIYNNNRIYSSEGKVVDTSNDPFVLGQFVNANGPVVYDTNNNLVCYASFDFSGNIKFQRFNPNTYIIQDNLEISEASGTVKNIITCGNDCYAFNTSDDQIIIVKEQNLGVSPFENDLKISIYPNPTSDYITIRSQTIIKNVQIVNIDGSIIKYLNPLNGKIDLSDLNNGLYFIKIINEYNQIVNKKIIKT